MKPLSTIFLLLFLANSLHAQEQGLYSYWPIFYPVEEGIQMIEIRFGLSKIPDDGNLSLLNSTRPNPPIYLFKNEKGKIVSAYNLCGYDLDDFDLSNPKFKTKNNQSIHQSKYYRYMKSCKRTKDTNVKYADVDQSKAQYGVVDRQGNIVINAKYEYLNVFSTTNIFVARKNGKYGVLDETGDNIHDFEFDTEILFWSSGNPTPVRKNKQWYYMNTSGELINKRAYDYGDKFWSRRARIKLEGKFGYIDSIGNEVVPPIYDGAESFYYNLAIVRKNGKYGCIDNQGNVIQDFIYDRIVAMPGDALGVSSSGYIAYQEKKETFLNIDGTNRDKRDLYYYNNKDYIVLSPIELSDGFTYCKPIQKLKSVQIDGKGSEEIVIKRVCSCNVSQHGGTYDITEHHTLERIEIWNTDKKKLLFQANTSYNNSYNRFQAYANPTHSRGTEGYAYELTIDTNGNIHITAAKSYPKGKTAALGNNSPDHKAGTYVFKLREYKRVED